jgi:hypothetical protein
MVAKRPLRTWPLGCNYFVAGGRIVNHMGRRVIERPCIDSRSQQELSSLSVFDFLVHRVENAVDE